MTTVRAKALETTYDLSPDDITRFDQRGFIHLPGLLRPEVVTEYEPEITSKVIDLNTMHLPMEERSTYNKAFLQVGNLWRHSEVVRELVFSKRLARVAAKLLGVEGVRLYFDQALYKEPGGGITPWHADQYYWPLATDRACTIWIPLQETPRPMGPLAFAAGSHRFEHGRDLPISDESEATLQETLASKRFPTIEEPFKLGDASVHLGWTFHRAGLNTTRVSRRAMTIVYIDADMVIADPVNTHQANSLEAYLPGVRPGDTADTPLTPVLYRS